MRTIGLMLLVFFCTQHIFSQEFTDAQKKLRSDIQTFLKEEGYMPEIESNGNIMFKKEGERYYVLIDKRDEAPLYLAISLSYTYSDNYTLANIASALKELNLNKGVKVACFDDSYSFRAEMYLVSSEHFKYTFYKLMSQILTVKTELMELCNSTGPTNNQSVKASSLTLKTLFPVYEVTIGKTTIKDVKNMGYRVNEKDTHTSCHVNDMMFWDGNNDKIFEEAILYRGDVVPEKWRLVGIDLTMSYETWKTFLEKSNFTVLVEDAPTVVEKEGRKTLFASLVAVSKTENLYINLDFEEGNRAGEGYSVNSRNTLGTLEIGKK